MVRFRYFIQEAGCVGMIYCVSDIHGELDKFERMLKLIRFSDTDHLYIIGDVIDRGAMGVDILRMIMDAPNMTMLLGNHEQMCLDTLGPHNEYGARDLWRQNGGMPTYRELLYHRTPHERNMILRFLASLPDQMDIVVGGQKFHLVHGLPGEDHDTRIWGRVAVDSKSPRRGTICIVGHTPTNFLTGRNDEDFRIWHGDGIIDIDCGCGNQKAEHRRLACLRLDDMAEFYVSGTDCEMTAPPLANDAELFERELPAALQHDLDAYKQGLQKRVSHLDCLWGELYGSINASQWDHSITEEQADYLRKKYLF